MPVKLRRSKAARADPRHVQAWEMVFECGVDYFRDLRPFGYESDEQARADAPKAWRAYGRQFLEQRPPNVNRAVPWALEAFGPPEDIADD